MKKPTKSEKSAPAELPPGTYRRGWKGREMLAMQKVRARADTFDKNRIRAEHVAKMDAERLALESGDLPPIPLRTKSLVELEADAKGDDKAEKKAKGKAKDADPADAKDTKDDPKPAEPAAQKVADEDGEEAIATVNKKD